MRTRRVTIVRMILILKVCHCSYVFTVDSLMVTDQTKPIRVTKRTQTKRVRSRNAYELRGSYTPVLQCLHSCHQTIDIYRTPYKTLNLLLHDNNYYTIMDISRFTRSNFKYYGCSKVFPKSCSYANVRRHIKSHCNKIKRTYKEGMVNNHMNMWREACELFSVPDTVFIPTIDNIYTSKYINYDFEARMEKVPVTKYPIVKHKHNDIIAQEGKPANVYLLVVIIVIMNNNNNSHVLAIMGDMLHVDRMDIDGGVIL